MRSNRHGWRRLRMSLIHLIMIWTRNWRTWKTTFTKVLRYTSVRAQIQATNRSKRFNRSNAKTFKGKKIMAKNLVMTIEYGQHRSVKLEQRLQGLILISMKLRGTSKKSSNLLAKWKNWLEITPRWWWNREINSWPSRSWMTWFMIRLSSAMRS